MSRATTANRTAASSRVQETAGNTRPPPQRATFPCQIGPLTRMVHGFLPSALKPKCMNITTLLDRQLLPCDVKWSLFVTAAYSVNYETNLEPFPPHFLRRDGSYNINKLVRIIHEVPNLYSLLLSVKASGFGSLDINMINLLHWVFVEMEQPVLRLVGANEFNLVMGKLQQEKPYAIPTQIFAVHDMPEFGQSNDIRDAAPKMCAFYCTDFYEFFAIINRGFKRFRNVGDSVNSYILHYQSKDALMQCQPTIAWGKAICGSVLSCVVLCEVGADELYVHDEENTMVVENGELIQVRYILLYGERIDDYEERHNVRGAIIRWMIKNNVMLNVTSYIVGVSVLVLINGRFIRACRRFVSEMAASFLPQLVRVLKSYG